MRFPILRIILPSWIVPICTCIMSIFLSIKEILCQYLYWHYHIFLLVLISWVSFETNWACWSYIKNWVRRCNRLTFIMRFFLDLYSKIFYLNTSCSSTKIWSIRVYSKTFFEHLLEHLLRSVNRVSLFDVPW